MELVKVIEEQWKGSLNSMTGVFVISGLNTKKHSNCECEGTYRLESCCYYARNSRS